MTAVATVSVRGARPAAYANCRRLTRSDSTRVGGRCRSGRAHGPSGSARDRDQDRVDAQALLGGLDVKARNAPFVARELGWRPRLTVPALVISEGTTARRHVEALAPLFSRFALRGHPCASWLRHPVGRPTGLLTFTKLPSTDGVDARRAGRRRVRPRTANPRSARPPTVAPSPVPAPNIDVIGGWQLRVWARSHLAFESRLWQAQRLVLPIAEQVIGLHQGVDLRGALVDDRSLGIA